MSTNGGGLTSSFRVKIASTGDSFEVPANKTVLRVLVENGYRVLSSCSDGRCGTCKTRYLSGEPDHRDSVLEPEERAEYLTVCVSRALSDELVLDLPDPNAARAPANPFELDRPVAIVTQGICVACLTCVRACEFGAARIDPGSLGVGGILGAATVDIETCTGCGLCAAACPTGAIGMTRYSDEDVVTTVDDLLAAAQALPVTPQRPDAPEIVAFCCPNSTSAANSYPAGNTDAPAVNLEIVEMPCTGRVDNLHVMSAFERGADGVLVTGCAPGRCNYGTGNLNAEKRVRWIRDWLTDVGLGEDRARMLPLPDDGAATFADAVNKLTEKLRQIGPSPIARNRVGSAGSHPEPAPAAETNR